MVEIHGRIARIRVMRTTPFVEPNPRPTQLELSEASQAEFVICDHTIDITYIRLRRGFAYLAIILDLFTRGLRGWHLGLTLSTELALSALERALRRGLPEILHSDQGVQYAADGYASLLQGLGVEMSMTAAQQPTQNPYAERVIRTIKDEEVHLSEYESFADAYERIGNFIEDVYQTKRIHSALGYLTPAEFESAYWEQWENPLT